MSEIENKENGEVKKKKDKKVENKTNQTMLRSMFGNLVSLSNLADQKAALMISVNSILVSVIITFVFGNDGFNKNLLYPILFLLAVCVLTIVFSIIATKPKLRSQKPSDQEVDLFFFQSFSSISNEAYQTQMKALMDNENTLQDKLLSNLHAQGKVLTRKYNQLKIAYTIFLVGFPISVLLVVGKMLGWY
jgi:Family of unknown function (DUF5706)